jgi:hypothetical protein
VAFSKLTNGPFVDIILVLMSSPAASVRIGDVLILEQDKLIYVDSIVSVVLPIPRPEIGIPKRDEYTILLFVAWTHPSSPESELDNARLE